MDTIQEAQDSITQSLAVIRAMAEVIDAARHSSMHVLSVAASDLADAAHNVGRAAGAIERVRKGGVMKLRTTSEVIAAVREAQHD